ncbi:MAG: hypothetical protein ABIP65_09300, partial [Vicinamibacterales bacterium]
RLGPADQTASGMERERMKRARRGAGGPADQTIDRLLGRASRANDNPRPPGACLDGETLAAWTDGSLAAAQRATAEAHAADCNRCLAVLAAIAKTSPPPSVTRVTRRLSVRWLVPLTTAAVALTAWVVVRSPEFQRPDPPAATAAIDAVKSAEPSAPPERDVSPQTRADDALKEKAVSPATSARSRDQAESRRLADAVARESTVASRKRDAPAPKPAAPPARAEAGDARLESYARASPPPRVIVSPDPDAQWRLAGTSTDRSTDGGRTWRAQPTGTTVELLAGSSPAPTVCWIVGRQGTVVLSTDGTTWRRLGFPDATIDLVAVTARDGVTASVTASNGRRYQTTDAGHTWVLQENPATPF